MIRRHSKKIAALVLSLALATTAVGAPAVYAASDTGSSTTAAVMAESSSGTESAAMNTFTWSEESVSAAAGGSGYTISAGTVTITESGTYKLTGSGKGNVVVQAEGVTLITDGLNLTSSTANTIETKASDTVIQVKGDNQLTNQYTVEDGTVAAICSYGQTLSITGTGSIVIEAPETDGQGIHADYTLNIGTEGSESGPSLIITTSDEAIEAMTLNLYSGSGTLTAGDDGINADNDADESQNCNLNILGGSWVINASGDGLDSNGNITVSGGNTLVYGSTSNDNAAIDFDGTLSFTGGTLLGVGMNGMAQTPSKGNYVRFSNISGITNGSKLEVRDTEGNTIYTAGAVKDADDVVLASYDLTDGDTYTLYVDGTEKASAEATSTGTAGGPGQGGQPGENGQQPPEQNGENGQQPPQMTQANFTDVSSSDYFAEPVYWAAATNITTGTTDTTFSPSDTTTRAQIVTFLWRLAGSPEPSADNTAYADVDSSSYYYKAVLWAEENGITTGTGENTFSPDQECTRSQIVTFLYRYAKTPDVEDNTSFTDVSADAYYADAVSWAAANAVTSGTSDTTFSPEESCTRGQAVTFLYNYAKTTGQAGTGMTPPSGEAPSGNPPELPSGEAPSGNPPELPSGEAPSGLSGSSGTADDSVTEAQS